MDTKIMTIILSLTVFFASALSMVWMYGITPKNLKSKNENKAYILILMAASFFMRAVFAMKFEGHSTDMNCFTAWSDMVFTGGISNFYSSEAFTDYPPGYMYVLYVIGAIRKLLSPSGGMSWLIVKLPAIICDTVTGWLIYKIAEKKTNNVIATVVSGVYLFNPAVILNSSIWGQVDAVHTLFSVLMLYLLTERKTIKAYFVFALCIFIKPQAFMFTPLIIFAIIENVFLPKFNKEKFFKNLIFGLCAIAMIFILAIPFGIGEVVKQYQSTLASYPYMTVNAFNLWGAFGMNWAKISPVMSIVNFATLALIVAYSAYVFFKTKHEGKYFFVGAILSFLTFMLSTKMHDRYAFPTMALLLVAFVYGVDVKVYLLYALSTLTQFFNAVWVLFIYEQDINKYYRSPVITIASIVNLLFMVYFIITTQNTFVNNKVTIKKEEEETEVQTEEKPEKKISFTRSEAHEKLKPVDYAIMAGIMIIYGAVAFYNLGDTKAPQTFTALNEVKEVKLDLGAEQEISKLQYYLGSHHLNDNSKLNVKCTDESGAEVFATELKSGSVFYWNNVEIDQKVRYITLSTDSNALTIMELGVKNKFGELVTPVNSSDDNVKDMLDEQALVPERATHLNSTYFDEIYHARTGYEFVHSLDVYEWTHPPLGKDFIAFGIKLFGMTPFGWRFMGTLFGVFMIPVLYIFAKRMFKYRWLAVVGTLLFTFDFMHFAQTRISTIDVYVTFFIMLMYYFMYKYYTMSFYDTPLKKTLAPLALSGICMGFGIASKWTGVYAGVGLGIIFFITLYKRYSEYLYAKSNPDGETDGISRKAVLDSFARNTRITILWCCLFFVFIPILIYGASYFMYLQAPSSQGIKTIIDNQNAIFAYHSKTVVESTHPFSSKWYEWIVMKRPIWFYSGTVRDGIKEGISSFGNPLVWWMLVPAIVIAIYNIFKKKDKMALFLVIAYVIQILFWIPVSRTTFIYHYFPCVPFIVLLIGYCIKDIYDNTDDVNVLGSKLSKKKAVIIGSCVYAALAIGMFILFYPVLSGAPCSVDFAENWLKWFDSWVLL